VGASFGLAGLRIADWYWLALNSRLIAEIAGHRAPRERHRKPCRWQNWSYMSCVVDEAPSERRLCLLRTPIACEDERQRRIRECS
jgi:hypothetical protein